MGKLRFGDVETLTVQLVRGGVGIHTQASLSGAHPVDP